MLTGGKKKVLKLDLFSNLLFAISATQFSPSPSNPFFNTTKKAILFKNRPVLTNNTGCVPSAKYLLNAWYVSSTAIGTHR